MLSHLWGFKHQSCVSAIVRGLLHSLGSAMLNPRTQEYFFHLIGILLSFCYGSAIFRVLLLTRDGRFFKVGSIFMMCCWSLKLFFCLMSPLLYLLIKIITTFGGHYFASGCVWRRFKNYLPLATPPTVAAVCAKQKTPS